VPVKFAEAFGFAAAASSIALTGCYSAEMAAEGLKAFCTVVVAAAAAASDFATQSSVAFDDASDFAAASDFATQSSVAFDNASDFAFVPTIAGRHRPYFHTSPCR